MVAMERPTRDVEAVRLATRRLLRRLDGLSDASAAAPSLLPGLDPRRGRDAPRAQRRRDAPHRRERATRRSVGAQYPGGSEERAADIAARSRRSASAVSVHDLRRAADSLMETWRTLARRRVGSHRGAGLRRHAHDAGLGGRALARGRAASRRSRRRVRPRRLAGRVRDPGPRRGRSRRSPERARRSRRAPASARRRRLPHRGDRSRPELDACGCATATPGFSPTRRSAPPVDGVVNGWGCDLVAWLYGRDDVADTITSQRRRRGAAARRRGFPSA